MAEEKIDNDLIIDGVGDTDPATGEPRVSSTGIVNAGSLNDDQKGHLTQFAPDIDDASFNNKGDIVSADGTIIMSKADLAIKLDDGSGGEEETEEEKVIRLAAEAAAAEEGDGTNAEKATKLIEDNNGNTIEIEGVEYTITDGVAHDKDGAIKFDKEALQVEMEKFVADNTSSDDDYISEISTMTGFTPVDDKGEPVVYDNSVEGIAKYVSDAVRQEGSRLHEESQTGFFTQYPQLKDAYNFLRVNQTLQGYGKVTDHSKVKLDKDNEEQLIAVIIEGEMMRGRTKEQAQRQVKYSKDDNRLFEDGTENLTFIRGREDAATTARANAVAAEDQAAADAATKYWGDIKTSIDAGTLEGYVIPENIQMRDENNKVLNKTRTDFYNYVSQTVDKEGNSAAALARAERGTELDLLIDYVMFTGGDLKSLVKLQMKKEGAKAAKLQLSRNSANSNRIVINKTKAKATVDNNTIK